MQAVGLKSSVGKVIWKLNKVNKIMELSGKTFFWLIDSEAFEKR